MASIGPLPRYPLPTPLATADGMISIALKEVDAANGFIASMGSLTASITPPTINPVFPSGATAPAVLAGTAPVMDDIIWVAPNAPADFTGMLDISNILPDPFEVDAPVLSFPAAPAAFSEAAPAAPGINLVFDDPTLDLTLPAPPSLLSLNVVPFDGLNIPTLDYTVPTLTVAEPSIREYTPGAFYTSSLLTSLKSFLQDQIDNGGTGLNANVEEAIWNRAREREARSAADALRQLEEMESLGYAFPPGVYVDGRIKIATETSYAEAGASREVMIKQAELAQANTQAALSNAIAIESKLIDYTNQVEQRFFESCKYATEAGIAIYNAKVQAYAAYVDAYKGRVQAYVAQVQAETAKVDAYRATIAAEQAKADINQALVQQYKVQVDAALANVEVFKARIAAIQTKAEIEKIKVETFGEQVRAYTARIGAYTAGVEGFRATIQAEATKQDAYKARVDAYVAQVTAASKNAEIRIAAFDGQLRAYTARWDGYKSAYQAESARAQAIAAVNSSRSDAFKAQVTGFASYNDTLTKQWQVALEQAQRTAEIGVSAAKANSDLYITTRSLALDAAKVGAQVSAQLGAAALNAVNFSTSISSSTSDSQSYGVSDSFSISASTSTSTNTNYNYSV